MPITVLRPNAAPPTLPILKANPPRATANARKYPRPGITLLATSCARSPETQIILQMFNCTIAVTIIVTTIANAAEAINCCVKTVVCVKKPGPIADVAIKKAAPSITCKVPFLLLIIKSS